MGLDRNERTGGDRRPRDNQEETTDRPRRGNFGEFARDKEGDDGDKPRRNGLTRNRTEQSSTWNRTNDENNDAPPPTRERFDRAKSWRERAAPPQDQPSEDRPRDRNVGRWDREHRQEREPEWFDEPAEDRSQGRTVQDLQKFMEEMKGLKEGGAATKINPGPNVDTYVSEATIDVERAKVKSAPAAEREPDQFFAKYASTPSAETEHPHELPKEAASAKAKGGSRFGSFFASQQGRQTEPSTPATVAPSAPEPNPLLFFGATGAANTALPTPSTGNLGGGEDKAAFQNILMKLQKQHITSNTPPSGGFPAPSTQEIFPQSSVASPGPYPSFAHELREGPPSRGLPQEIFAHRQQPSNYLPQAPITTESQLLQNLIAQRQPIGGQTSGRGDQNQTRNSQTAFLMSLMQSGRNPPEAQRNEPHIRMPQPSRPAQIPQTPDREPDFTRDRSGSHQQGRPQGPPGFFDEAHIRHEQDNRRQQPTQILQRPGPMGIDQLPPNWMQGNGQQLPPGPGRPMIPPPGLAGNLRNDLRNELRNDPRNDPRIDPRNDPRIDPRIDPRNAPMPGIFPPGFPPIGVFPPDAMRNMAPPPGLFGGPGAPAGPPPPGFLPPGMGGAFHGGPEALAFGFDGRGMPPPGAANFRRN